ncbi:Na+/H+ antiporter NhaA [Methylomarinum roseum]|uniref:Na+/H+ antiporter NhaA n=1 Tax=Methylomarinum roseum TaxID=3067653 RepID=UPI003D7CB1D2
MKIGAFEFTRSLREWINDALMTLFFFLVALYEFGRTHGRWGRMRRRLAIESP